jgi:tRNA U38,U39,U40 pseudouridine synthase TruA
MPVFTPRGKFANVKLNRSWTPEKLRNAINGNLWRDIRIINVEKAGRRFPSPAFAARWKDLRISHSQRACDVAFLAKVRPFTKRGRWTSPE